MRRALSRYGYVHPQPTGFSVIVRHDFAIVLVVGWLVLKTEMRDARIGEFAKIKIRPGRQRESGLAVGQGNL